MRALVAFSGEVVDKDVPGEPTYTELGMNNLTADRDGLPRLRSDGEVPERFASDDFQVLLVANKYQTGFDEPQLHTMYVDKRLAGVQAVQTLSRLNRTCSGKEDTFVLDFVNEREEILASFQDYYEGAHVEETVDPQRLYKLQTDLDAAQLYLQPEVDRFTAVFFKPGAVRKVQYDLLFWSGDLPIAGKQQPLLIVLEEAHLYLPEGTKSAAHRTVTRIAKEGRKYGVGLLVVTQRPSEIDHTVLSQCGTLVSLRSKGIYLNQCVKNVYPFERR